MSEQLKSTVKKRRNYCTSNNLEKKALTAVVTATVATVATMLVYLYVQCHITVSTTLHCCLFEINCFKYPRPQTLKVV
jgi:hypothetical protein